MNANNKQNSSERIVYNTIYYRVPTIITVNPMLKNVSATKENTTNM